MGCESEHCFFAASRRCVEKNQKAERHRNMRPALQQLINHFSAEPGRDGSTKFWERPWRCKSMQLVVPVLRSGSLHCFATRRFTNLLKWSQFLAKRPNREGSRSNNPSSAIDFDKHGSAASFSRYRLCEKLPTGLLSSCNTSLETEKSHWGGC